MTGSALRVLDAAAVRRWCAAGCRALADACPQIDALNVFPVPDGDTGTNLLLTMTAAAAALPPDSDLATTVRVAADGGLRGARGSSGTILSQFLSGLADGLSGCDAATGRDLQAALCRAAESAYAAVAQPVEGTILTVARAAATAAAKVDSADLAAVCVAACTGARDELALTPDQLPVLAAAGVVDAGGQGLVVLLDALLEVVTGTPSPRLADARPSPRLPPDETNIGFAYEVQFLLDAPDEAIAGLRDRLGVLGDSLVIGGGNGLHHVHVHVDDVGAAIEAGVDTGRPHDIRVTRFADQIGAAPHIIAFAPPGGLADVFRSAGAVVVPSGRDPVSSLREMADTIRAGPARPVVVLPNSRPLRASVDEAAQRLRADGRTVVVIPTRSPLQGLAALAVHDISKPSGDDVVAMVAAAAATRYAEVVVATESALTSAGPCVAGDLLGLIDDDVAVIGSDLRALGCLLLDRMLAGGGEVVTIVVGGLAAGLSDDLLGHVAGCYPTVETVSIDGGPSSTALLIGVE